MALRKAATDKLRDLNLSLRKVSDDYEKANEVYQKELSDYAKLVSSLSSGARKSGAIPPQFPKTYNAVVKAVQLSKNALSALITQTLAEKKYMLYMNLLNPPGKLILDAPDTGKPGHVMGNMIVYEKGGRQYAYRETSQTLQGLAQHLGSVKQVYDSRPSLKQIFNKWNNALSN